MLDFGERDEIIVRKDRDETDTAVVAERECGDGRKLKGQARTVPK
jgi:hypothetical protein